MSNYKDKPIVLLTTREASKAVVRLTIKLMLVKAVVNGTATALLPYARKLQKKVDERDIRRNNVE